MSLPAGWNPTRRKRWLAEAWRRGNGKAWEPSDHRHPVIEDAIREGYIRRTDGICGFERIKDAMLVWTEAGRLAISQFLAAPPEAPSAACDSASSATAERQA